MRRQLVGILLDLLFLVASIGNGGAVANAVRTLVVVLCGVAVALGVFFAVVLALGVAAQRQPPYPMEPGVWP
jgi:hypothetical protein